MSDQQFHFNLPILESRAEQDFLVSASNRNAVERIDAWPDWPGGSLALSGPASSGKSHLAAIWAERVGAHIFAGDTTGDIESDLPGSSAVLIDDADQITAEEALLHIFNWQKEQGGSLLLTGSEPPSKWPVGLPDLSSRLATMTVAEIEPPDDALLAGVIGKQLADRQVRVSTAVIDYLLRRMERSFAAAQQIVERLDALSLSEGRPITVPLARKVFEAR